MVDLVALLSIYAGLILLVVVTLLFGENPAFRRTPLPRLHWLLTEGPLAATEAVTRRLPGRAANCCHQLGGLCCERSNPAAQILFLGLLAGCYWLFARYVFPMLPLPGLPAWHRHTGTAAALACVALFLRASFADPGAVTAANLAAHQALYPYDEVLYGLKDCRTCSIPRPARSKHCGVCGRCVARLDHHCIWINSCVGLLNMRAFLAFLAATAALCFYAASLGFRAIRADMARQEVWSLAFLHPETDRLIYLGDSRSYLLHFVNAQYGPQVGVTFFAGAAGWIVLGFLVYQLWLICTGLTTAEVHKRQDLALARQLREEVQEMEQRVEAQLAAGHGSAAGGNVAGAAPAAWETGSVSPADDGPGSSSNGVPALTAGRQRQSRQRPPPLPNLYDRGVWTNLSEVLFPHYHLRLAAAAAAAGTVGGTGSSVEDCSNGNSGSLKKRA